MSERHLVHVEVASVEEGDADWPGQRLDEFLAWVQTKVDTVPVEHIGEVTIKLGSEGGDYGSSTATIDIGYTRPESESEKVERLRVEDRDCRHNDHLSGVIAQHRANLFRLRGVL